MTGVDMTVIVPTRFLRDPVRFERAIENTLDGAALDIKVDFAVTTSTWTNQPRFYIRKTKGERFIGTDGLIYKFVSGGTKPHLITAHTPKGLAFYATGFRPKSRVRFIGSNKGQQANKDFRRPMVVHHPGTQAREYPEVIKEKWDQELPKIFQRAIDSEVN
jgi:hypothetical protein